MTTTYSNFSRQEQESILNAYKALTSTEDRKKTQNGKTANLDRTILKKKSFLKKRGLSVHDRKKLTEEIATLQIEYCQAFGTEQTAPVTSQPSPKQKEKFYRPKPIKVGSSPF